MKRNLCIGVIFLGLLAAFGVGSALLQKRAAVDAAEMQAPMFEVDPFWPKPLPNHWLIGMTIGVSVDAQDNVWIVHRLVRASPGDGRSRHCLGRPPIRRSSFR